MARRWWLAVIVAGAVLGAGLLLHARLWKPRAGASVASGPRAPAVARAPAAHGSGPSVQRVHLTQAAGDVEINHGGRGWGAAQVGDELHGDDSIRAGQDGSAVLEVGERAEVRMLARSEFLVAEISQQVARVRLEQGRVAAAVRAGGESKLVVQFRGSPAVAEVVEGEFSALTDGRGLVAVVTSAGQVRLSAQHGTVNVMAGEQSVVHGQSVPSAPVKIPASLFLKVGRATSAPGVSHEITLRGTTTPGALVSVNGRDAVVEQQGRFEARVSVKEGANEIVVRAEDALGRQQTDQQSFVLTGRAKQVSARPGDLESRVTW